MKRKGDGSSVNRSVHHSLPVSARQTYLQGDVVRRSCLSGDATGVRNAEGLLCISQRRPSHGCRRVFDVGAEFAGAPSRFIQIGGAAKAFEKEIGEAMLTCDRFALPAG